MQKFYIQGNGKNRNMGCLEFQIEILYCKRFNLSIRNTFNGQRQMFTNLVLLGSFNPFFYI